MGKEEVFSRLVFSKHKRTKLHIMTNILPGFCTKNALPERI